MGPLVSGDGKEAKRSVYEGRGRLKAGQQR